MYGQVDFDDSDVTAAMFHSSVLILYLGQIVLLNLSMELWLWLTENCPTLVGVLCVKHTNEHNEPS